MLIDSVIFDRRTGEILPPSRPTTAQVDDDLIDLPPLRQKIWRYMSYEKFEDFLKSRRLYCRRLDRLPDGLEALLSTGNFRQRTAVAQALHNGYKIQENHDQEIFQSQWMRQLYFVNCWHINDSENRTMWRLYAPYAESVVVISRVAMLRAYAASCYLAGHLSAKSNMWISIIRDLIGYLGEQLCSKTWHIVLSEKFV